jgi:hypothetical protein
VDGRYNDFTGVSSLFIGRARVKLIITDTTNYHPADDESYPH